MQTPEARLEAYRRVPTFSKLDDTALERLDACVRWRHLRKGEVLFRQGDRGDSLVVVGEGSFAVSVFRSGVEVEVARVGAGEVVGEMACIDPAPRSATLVAAAPSTVAELSGDALRSLRTLAPAVASHVVGAVIREVTRRLREIEERIDGDLAPAANATPSRPPAAADEPSGLWRFLDRLRGQA